MTDETVSELNYDSPEPLLNALAEIFAYHGAAKEVAILAESKGRLEQCDYDNWDGGTYIYRLLLMVPRRLYSQLLDSKENLEKSIYEQAEKIFGIGTNDWLRFVVIIPELGEADPQWRDKAKAWVAGLGVSNQGRVRSDNIVPKTCDGLLFRSQAEINLYQALKSKGVSFAPLPVFIRGGETYRRIEPDFIVIKDGVVLHIEVDGDTVHQESPAEAHDRTSMLNHEGVHIERVRASECNSSERAKECAKKLLAIIEKRKALR